MLERCKFVLLYILVFALCSGCATKKQKPRPTKDVSIAGSEAVNAYRKGHSARSLVLYRELLSVDPDNHVYLNNLGVLLLETGQGEEALKAFENASLRAPGVADYIINIGFARLHLGDIDEALVFFNRANRMAPGYAKAFYGKGVAFLELDEPEIALGAFHKAVALDPEDDEALFMKAYAEQRNGLWLDAISDYSSYLAIGKNNRQRANAYSNRALCAFQLERYDQGMADLRQAMELDDSVAAFYYNRALGHQMQHQYEAAIADYIRAISRNTDFPEAYINRGELNYLIGNVEKGCSDMQRACSLGVCGKMEQYEAAGKCQ